MCLIIFAYKIHKKYPLVLAANRDEFYQRQTLPAHFWEDYPEILAGRDKEKMGTWLGVTKKGRFAALTNYRDPNLNLKESKSRGNLVADYLKGNKKPYDYLLDVKKESINYNPFNLLIGDRNELFYFSKVIGEIIKIKPGVYALSNKDLDTPWPKVVKGKAYFRECLKEKQISKHCLFEFLRDTELAPTEELPDTGMGLEWEMVLSPIFIKSDIYGTRSSTVLYIDNNMQVEFIERTYYKCEDNWDEKRYKFYIDTP